jgi:hypothetical protein
MKLRNTRFTIATILAAALGAAPAADYDAPAVLQASKILPKELVSGPNFQVEENVTNDGFLNVYTIKSNLGTVQATSTATLRKYAAEIDAGVRMSAIRGSSEFAAGVKEKAGAVVEGAKGLVTDPVDTVSSAASGVGKLFSRAGENLFGGSRSEAEGSRMADLLGYSKTKRDYAAEFGVDAYSRNALMQRELDEISRAGYLGNMTASAALMAVPGGAGAAVSVAGSTTLMNNVFRDLAPPDLRIRNRETMQAMGVSADVSDLFLANAVYTPREQTLLIEALASMKATKHRDAYIKFAVLSADPHVAYFRQRQAQMYAALNATAEPIAEFVHIGEVSAGKTAAGKLVFAAPLDHMLWTKSMAAFASIITGEVANMSDVKERHLWVAGTLSPLAKKSLETMAWKVHPNSERLLKNAPL